jgi:DNA helicase II / ATP-dependent DNA helicase PcrA
VDDAAADHLELAREALAEAGRRWGVRSAVGVMVVESARRRSTVLLGSATHTSRATDAWSLAVVDWRTAPLAEPYFGVAEGDVWEGPGGPVKVWWKAGLETREGQVVGHFPAERWTPVVPPPTGRQGFRSPLDVQLDAAQQALVDAPAGQPLLVLGEAGFGKTTVALRRLEALAHRHGPGFRAAVVVPTEGLRRLTARVLQQRGLGQVEVNTFDAWARRLAHQHFKLPRQQSRDASSRTITLKRHPALRGVLGAFVERRRRATTRADLLHLFGDTAWLAKVVEVSAGALHPASVAEVAEHTRVQFLETTETAYAHVTDAARLQAVDGEALDEGTPEGDAHSIDAEDYPVLFALEAARARRAGRPVKRVASWDALVVDEAQELAPLELELLSRSLKAEGTLTVAGDAAQQIDPTTSFAGWDEVMAALGAARHARGQLQVNYRCPPDVTVLARTVLAGAPRLEPSAHVHRLGGPHPAQVLVRLIAELRNLQDRAPGATVAVIARSAEAARTLARQLGWAVPVHLALEGDFRFREGLVVTAAAEVKGLEFDVVVVPEAAGGAWTSTPEALRSLYVAVTRATCELVLTTPT